MLLLIFLRDLLDSAFKALDKSFLGTLEGMFHVELLLGGSADYLTATSVNVAFNYLYLISVGLITLKFLFKGFEVYILWRDGDADASPQSMVVGAVQALVVTAVFPTLYDVMAEVTLQLTRGLMSIFGAGQAGDHWLPTALMAGTGLLGLIELLFALVFVILAVVLTVKLIGRGFELLILRLGIPFACVGLVDSDGGVFKSYMQIFYKTVLTSVIQTVFLTLAFRVVSGLTLPNLICGTALVTTALSTPVIMQQILAPSRAGGGVTNKIYSGAMAVNTVKSLIGKVGGG
jgi:hypothetical protein